MRSILYRTACQGCVNHFFFHLIWYCNFSLLFLFFFLRLFSFLHPFFLWFLVSLEEILGESRDSQIQTGPSDDCTKRTVTSMSAAHPTGFPPFPTGSLVWPNIRPLANIMMICWICLLYTYFSSASRIFTKKSVARSSLITVASLGFRLFVSVVVVWLRKGE